MRIKSRGSRAEVMHGTAKRTSGGLRKKDLKYNKSRRIVSKKASARAKKENRLVKAGYKTKKGQFGSFKKGKRISRRRSKRKSRRRQHGGGLCGPKCLKAKKTSNAVCKIESPGKTVFTRTVSEKKAEIACQKLMYPVALDNSKVPPAQLTKHYCETGGDNNTGLRQNSALLRQITNTGCSAAAPAVGPAVGPAAAPVVAPAAAPAAAPVVAPAVAPAAIPEKQQGGWDGPVTKKLIKEICGQEEEAEKSRCENVVRQRVKHHAANPVKRFNYSLMKQEVTNDWGFEK